MGTSQPLKRFYANNKLEYLQLIVIIFIRVEIYDNGCKKNTDYFIAPQNCSSGSATKTVHLLSLLHYASYQTKRNSEAKKYKIEAISITTE